MYVNGIKLPCVGSSEWHKLIKDARKLGLTHSQFKQLVKAANIQHNATFKTGKIKAQQLDKMLYSGGKGVGAARNTKAAPMASKHSRISARISFNQ